MSTQSSLLTVIEGFQILVDSKIWSFSCYRYFMQFSIFRLSEHTRHSSFEWEGCMQQCISLISDPWTKLMLREERQVAMTTEHFFISRHFQRFHEVLETTGNTRNAHLKVFYIVFKSSQITIEPVSSLLPLGGEMHVDRQVKCKMQTFGWGGRCQRMVLRFWGTRVELQDVCLLHNNSGAASFSLLF